MRFRKTPLNQRGTYTYHFAAGESVTLTPGKNGVTELDIKALHSAGDSEVYFNIKNTRPKLTEEEKAAIKDWEDKHPGEEAPKNWNLSIESLQDDGVDLDKSSILADASYSPFEDVSPEVERLREVVEMLTPDQQALYRRVFLLEESQVEIAAELGITKQALQSRLNKIKAKIKKNY